MMQYRPITQQEYPAFSDLQAHSFFFARDYEKLQEYARQEGGDKHVTARGAFSDDGKLMAGMDLLPYTQQFDGHWVGMGGIGGVCTKPEYRRQGHIRQLFRLVFEEMYQRGDVFSYLYPFSVAYYRQYGYETAGAVHIYSMPLATLHCHKLRGSAEQFLSEMYGDDAGDPGPIVAVYEAWSAGHNLAVERTGAAWRKLLEVDPANAKTRAYLLRNPQGQPAAYVVFRVDGDTLHVTDAAWAEPQGLTDIAGFLGGLAGNLRNLVWRLPAYLPPDILFPEWLNPLAQRNIVGMNRVINVQKALELMRKRRREATVKLRVRDSWIPANDALF
ncbi:MAG: GNAT family N-acetyltransferase [Eubacteriales bacterium]|nr:GNAT family N-acetyltransferase [Eubacteriales bacterium]